DLPDVLVDHAELVAGLEPRLDVDVPAEDVCQVARDARRHAGGDRVLAETTLDRPGDAFHLDEGGQGLEGRRDAGAGLLGDPGLPLVDLVANRLERVRLALEAERETLARSDLGQIEDVSRGGNPLARLGNADAASGQDVLDGVTLANVDVLVDQALVAT